MISPTLPTIVALPLALPTGRESQNPTGLTESTTVATSTDATGIDQLVLTPPAEQTGLSVRTQQLSLRFHAHAHTRELSHGQTRTMVHAKLRFQYEFEAADGTSIRVRVKANLHYQQSSFGGDELQSIKLSFKARVDLLSEDVTEEISPLLEAPELPDETKQVVSQALGKFQRNADSAGIQFVETKELDGDRLVTNLVDAFNGLSKTLDATTDITSENQAASPTSAPMPVPDPEKIEISEPSQTPATAPDVATSPADPQVPPDSGPIAATTIRSAAFRARVRIMQSLRHMVDALGDDTTTASRQVSRWKLQISAMQSAFSIVNTTDNGSSTPNDIGFDTQG